MVQTAVQKGDRYRHYTGCAIVSPRAPSLIILNADLRSTFAVCAPLPSEDNMWTASSTEGVFGDVVIHAFAMRCVLLKIMFKLRVS